MRIQWLFGIMVFFFGLCNKVPTYAQTSIDTIVVNLSGDSSKTESTPSLNLKALFDKARADSIRIAKIAVEKDKANQKKLQDLKEKRRLEKLAKEKQQKELAEKKKLEKEAKKEEQKQKKALAEKAKKAAKDKEKVTLAKKAAADKVAKKKAAELALKKVKKEDKDEERKAKELALIKAKEESIAKEKAKVNEIAKQVEENKKKISKQIKVEQSKKELPIKTSPEKQIISTKKESNALPIPPPPGVVQKDNVYGTVRLAYDDNAASFLLSIPTETKMHYHAKHSEQIMLIEGSGMLLMGYKTIKLRKNELVFITQGTPHKIINNGKGKLKVLSIQAPFYDGTDIIILE